MNFQSWLKATGNRHAEGNGHADPEFSPITSTRRRKRRRPHRLVSLHPSLRPPPPLRKSPDLPAVATSKSEPALPPLSAAKLAPQLNVAPEVQIYLEDHIGDGDIGAEVWDLYRSRYALEPIVQEEHHYVKKAVYQRQHKLRHYSHRQVPHGRKHDVRDPHCPKQHERDHLNERVALVTSKLKNLKVAKEDETLKLEKEFKRMESMRKAEELARWEATKGPIDEASRTAKQAAQRATEVADRIVALCERNAREMREIRAAEEKKQFKARKELERQKRAEERRVLMEEREEQRRAKVKVEQQRRAERMVQLGAAVEQAAVRSTGGGVKIANVPADADEGTRMMMEMQMLALQHADAHEDKRRMEEAVCRAKAKQKGGRFRRKRAKDDEDDEDDEEEDDDEAEEQKGSNKNNGSSSSKELPSTVRVACTLSAGLGRQQFVVQSGLGSSASGGSHSVVGGGGVECEGGMWAGLFRWLGLHSSALVVRRGQGPSNSNSNSWASSSSSGSGVRGFLAPGSDIGSATPACGVTVTASSAAYDCPTLPCVLLATRGRGGGGGGSNEFWTDNVAPFASFYQPFPHAPLLRRYNPGNRRGLDKARAQAQLWAQWKVDEAARRGDHLADLENFEDSADLHWDHPYIHIDLGRHRMSPTSYTLRHAQGSFPGTHALCTWQLQASFDGRAWEVLSDHRRDRSLIEACHARGSGGVAAPPLPRPRPAATGGGGAGKTVTAPAQAKTAAAVDSDAGGVTWVLGDPAAHSSHAGPVARRWSRADSSSSSSSSPLLPSDATNTDNRRHKQKQRLHGLTAMSQLRASSSAARGPFRAFRIVMTGANTSSAHWLCLGGFEVHGEVLQSTYSAGY